MQGRAEERSHETGVTVRRSRTFRFTRMADTSPLTREQSATDEIMEDRECTAGTSEWEPRREELHNDTASCSSTPLPNLYPLRARILRVPNPESSKL